MKPADRTMLPFSCDSPARQRHAWWWTQFAMLSALLGSVLAAQASPIFYPADPPPLGAPLPAPDPAGVLKAVPVGLATHVNECFYAPLSTWLAADSTGARLSDALRGRLDSYRATKVALQTEL